MAIKRGDTTAIKKYIIEKGQESRIDWESMEAVFRIEAQKYI